MASLAPTELDSTSCQKGLPDVIWPMDTDTPSQSIATLSSGVGIHNASIAPMEGSTWPMLPMHMGNPNEDPSSTLNLVQTIDSVEMIELTLTLVAALVEPAAFLIKPQ